MSKDLLENFVKSHRQQFDEAVPAEFIWSDIDKTINKSKSRKFTIWRVSAIAASVVLLVMIGAIGGIYVANSSSNEHSFAESAVMKEYLETEKYYQHRVNYYWEELEKENFDPTVKEDMDQLDAVYFELKSELLQSSYGNEEAIINAMIQNYQTKLEILKKVLNRMSDIKINDQLKPTKNETI